VAAWYDEQNSFHEQGVLVSRNTTGVHLAKNAGLGLEFGSGARRLAPVRRRLALVCELCKIAA